MEAASRPPVGLSDGVFALRSRLSSAAMPPRRAAPSPRTVRLLLASGLFVLLMLIALFVRDRFVRPTGGDVLVVAFLYFLLRGLSPLSRAPAAALVFVFAAGVELTQAGGLVQRLGLADHALARTVLGSVFDWKDIAAYAVGALACRGSRPHRSESRALNPHA